LDSENAKYHRLPPWARKKITLGPKEREVVRLLRRLHLHTVCEEARCPNIGECFGRRTAAFMILGDVCTRDCGFCAVAGGEPQPPDPEEPRRLAEAAEQLGLVHVVITSVTRDDLPLGGAEQFAACVRALREAGPETPEDASPPSPRRGRPLTVEILTPDFNARPEALAVIAAEPPDIFNHNVETVPRLYSAVRPQADYRRSLAVLARMKELSGDGLLTKSGLMVGLGEERDEIARVLEDLREAGCELVTIGQYLRPSRRNLPVVRYYAPEEFEGLRELGEALGFQGVFAGVYVRSSYMAERQVGS